MFSREEWNLVSTLLDEKKLPFSELIKLPDQFTGCTSISWLAKTAEIESHDVEWSFPNSYIQDNPPYGRKKNSRRAKVYPHHRFSFLKSNKPKNYILIGTFFIDSTQQVNLIQKVLHVNRCKNRRRITSLKHFSTIWTSRLIFKTIPKFNTHFQRFMA